MPARFIPNKETMYTRGSNYRKAIVAACVGLSFP